MEHSTELRHFGVRGMKWGVRKAASSTGEYVKAVGGVMKRNYLHPIQTDRAIKASIATGSGKTKARRMFVASSTKELKDVSKRTDNLVAAQKKKMADMTPAQKNLHRERVVLLVANSALAGVNISAAMSPKNPIRVISGVVGVANIAAAAKLSKDLKNE